MQINDMLDYWYKMELFNPSWPVNVKKDINFSDEKYPWPKKDKKDSEQITFDVYIGKASCDELIKWMMEKLHLDKTDKIEPNNSLCCLCALKVDINGLYVSDSFAVSSFIWAICKYANEGLEIELDENEISEIESGMNKKLIGETFKNTFSFSKNVFIPICKKFDLNDSLIEYNLWAKEKVQNGKLINKNPVRYEFPPINPSTELLSSFYLKDIKRIKEHPTDKIKQYVMAMDSFEKGKHIEIDTNIEKMKYWLEVEKFPLGMWPSKYHPCLMQQIGINLAISDEQPIFSINGPPGTGKTTLLKEIIVSNIVQRAVDLSKYKEPDDAFTAENFLSSTDESNQKYYSISKELTKYGIIVASNNNAAVENISLELPELISDDRSGYFSGFDFTNDTSEIYFSQIATQLTEKPAWGLLSAKLGKKRNISDLRYALSSYTDKIGFFNYYDDSIPDWEKAKASFVSVLNEVLDIQKKISSINKRINESKFLKSDISEIEKQYTQVKENLELCESDLHLINEKIKQSEVLKESKHKNIECLLSELSNFKITFWKLFKKNPLIVKWKSVEVDIENIVLEIINKQDLYNEKEILLSDLQKQYDKIENELNNKKTALSNLLLEIDRDSKEIELEISDSKYWENIDSNEESQESLPWISKVYDKKREELFYQSILLHKAFILNSNCVEQNIKKLLTMWQDRFTIEDKKLAYGDLINTLQLLIPVISTTFASVETFLDGIQAEELGLLIIDEAGQATPQSALGAIWRAKKVIIVGDPLQVEPIVTIPEELQTIFAEKNNINSIYKSSGISVQLLGDSLNIFGGNRIVNGEEVWVGCPLLLHRRCLDPMFTISNKVAYNNRMFKKTAPPSSDELFFLSDSCWLDIKGKVIEKGNQNVENQNAAVLNLLENAIKKHKGLPDLFIITPFRRISDELKKKIRSFIQEKHSDIIDANQWIDSHCGTIHTFQGKEASEAILVLGCDSSVGKGAALWVGKKPNIINVAVSRAKYRICIIGDYDLWNKIPNVNTAAKNLKRISDESEIVGS